jgi:hypothetical protein
MDEIQKQIIRQGKRSPITRLFRGGDKEAITTWKLEFNEILRVFNVRPVVSAWSLLTSRFQTELVVTTWPTVPDTRHDFANTHTTTPDARHGTPDADNIVSGVRSEIVNKLTTASDIHRNKLRSREDVDGQKQAVSITHTLTVIEYPLTVA